MSEECIKISTERGPGTRADVDATLEMGVKFGLKIACNLLSTMPKPDKKNYPESASNT